MKEKECVMCGKLFAAERNQKTCSDACSKALRKSSYQRWLDSHPGYMAEYFKANNERYTRPARRERKQA